jgi:hypothetical protein
VRLPYHTKKYDEHIGKHSGNKEYRLNLFGFYIAEV